MSRYAPPQSDLAKTLDMFKRANIDHRYWPIREREDGVKFEGYALVVGVEGAIGPYVEYTFDDRGALVTAEPVQQTEREISIARTVGGVKLVTYHFNP